jgi:ABC-type multidrug transport system fused ATPase/permease subunit
LTHLRPPRHAAVNLDEPSSLVPTLSHFSLRMDEAAAPPDGEVSVSAPLESPDEDTLEAPKLARSLSEPPPPADSFSTQFSSLSSRQVILTLVRPALFPSRPEFALFLALSVVLKFVAGVLKEVPALAIAWFIEGLSSEQPTVLWHILLLPIVAGQIHSVLADYSNICRNVSTAPAGVHARELFAAHCFRLPEHTLTTDIQPSRLASISWDAEQVPRVATNALHGVLQPTARLFALLYAASALFNAPAMAIAVILLGSAIVVWMDVRIAEEHSKMSGQWQRSFSGARDAYTALQSITHVKLDAWQWWQSRFIAAWDRLMNTAYSSEGTASEGFERLKDAVKDVTHMTVLGLCGLAVLQGDMSVGKALGVASLVERLMSTISEVTSTTMRLSREWKACSVVVDVMSKPVEDEDPEAVRGGGERWWQNNDAPALSVTRVLEAILADSAVGMASGDFIVSSACLSGPEGGRLRAELFSSRDSKPSMAPPKSNLLTLFHATLLQLGRRRLSDEWMRYFGQGGKERLQVSEAFGPTPADAPDSVRSAKRTARRELAGTMWDCASKEAVLLDRAELLQFARLRPSVSVSRILEWAENTAVPPRLEFRDVHFSYPPRSTASTMSVPVLRGLNLTIEPGETVALVGASGGGKSTVLKLLTRQYDLISRGQILIDGVDIRSIPCKLVRERMAVVPQEVSLDDDSIVNNIRAGYPQASLEDCIQAGKDAALSPLIAKLHDEWFTQVGENGVKLSGGERQRVAIARAIVRRAGLLLLDESTSALDTATERSVQATIDSAKSRRTTVMIAHRLATVRNADKIVVIRDGTCAEVGTHDALLAANGVYAGLWKAQASTDE